MSSLRTFLNGVVNWGIEFGPILGFFISLYVQGDSRKGFVDSTGIFVALTLVALLVALVKDQRVALFPLIAGAFVVVFGLATVATENPLIFIVKDTIYNGSFALFLFWGILRGRGNLRPLFEHVVDIKPRGWYQLSFRWALWFALLSVSNEIVWRNFSPHAWVAYKLFTTVATTAFGFAQFGLTRKYRMDTATPWGLRVHQTGHTEDPFLAE